ncbi:hypothetical protein E3O62_13235 [Cryobacterium sp. TMT2-15-1]|uniref:hypothetical protein n=1 Tax=Cryobacterium sp. TMT2-15-1 TaxID=1259246 RepID=UPI001069DC1C|nr:hypothetical protein [Cryobacterium sp. TMT2-15-1]TFC55931.1 hypothetical protein E3O62_13235 [Cryobacterium sp. TMT2-15-1]
MSSVKGHRRLDGLGLLTVATIVAGVSGYLVLWLVAAQVGPSSYAQFAVFWSAVYLIVGSLAGIQQEITRATHPVDTESAGPPAQSARPSKLQNYAAILVISVMGLVVVSSPLWSKTVFSGDPVAYVVPLTIGVGGYVVVAVLCGTLYGLGGWMALAWMIALDSILRLVCTGLALLVTTDPGSLAWAVVVPFPLTPAILWLFMRKGVRGRSAIDVRFGRLSWNIVRSIAASASTAIIVSGFPLIVSATSGTEPAATLGVLLLAITLTRAPLVVPLMSLQSFLVIQFRGQVAHVLRKVWVILAGIALVAALLALIAFFIGPQVFEWMFGDAYRIEAITLALLVLSSFGIGALCVSGPAVLARGLHAAYSAGWMIAAGMTVLAMFLPLDLVPRVLASLLIGPLLGLLVHLLSLTMFFRRKRVSN